MLLLPLAFAAPTLLDAVVTRAGDPYREPGLQFTFAVGGKARTHRWDIPGGKVLVSWNDERGECSVVTTVPYTGTDPLQKEAWAYFTNDQYWLLAPSKLRDPGVNVAEQGDDLVVTFAQVGLTPGDRYTFHVDRATGDVTGWTYVLESGRTGSWTWARPTAVGGLQLSLERTSPDRTILFTGVRSEAITLPAPGGACEPVEKANPLPATIEPPPMSEPSPK